MSSLVPCESAPNSAAAWRAHYSAVRARLNPAPAAQPASDSPAPAPAPTPPKPSRVVPRAQGNRALEYLRGKRTVETIKEIVAAFYGVSVLDLVSERRTARVVPPRQVAMYLCQQMTPKSLPEIGRRFGGRDHTTILYAVNKMAAKAASDPAFRATLAALADEILEANVGAVAPALD